MRRLFNVFSFFLVLLMLLALPSVAFAQDDQPKTGAGGLVLYTVYPAQTIGLGETVTFNLKLTGVSEAQVVKMEMDTLADGWTATFRGSGKLIQSVYVQTTGEASVDLKLEPVTDVQPGTYNFVVAAVGRGGKALLPLEVVIKDKLPPRLSFNVDLPTIKGSPTTTFRWTANLKNEGEDDLNVSLSADVPKGFQISFKLSGQEVTDFPISAGESRSLSVEAQVVSAEVTGGNYPFTIRATSESAQAEQALTAEVSGQISLNITTPDGRLSGQAYSGKDNSLKVVVVNNGSAPARGVKLTSSAPKNWKVEFSPDQIDELPAGQQVEVNVNIQPSNQAVAGDYVLTLQAKPTDGTQKSAEFRITVLTSTLWGVVGVVLIAVAVIVVAVAVMRFGRR